MSAGFSPAHLLRYATLAAIALLSACAQLKQQPEPATDTQAQWALHQQQLASLQDWHIMDKLGIRTPAQTNSARFNWQQQQQHFDIRVTTLLGQGVMSLQGSSGDVLLTIAGQGEYHTRYPEALLMRELGWTLPVDALNYWVRGLPSPDSQANYQLNEQGQLNTLEQAGWQLSFSRYQALDRAALPGKILLQKGDNKLTLVIKKWAFK